MSKRPPLTMSWLGALLLFSGLARADSVNQHSAGWTELPHEGGNVTIEEARPKPSVTPEAVASAVPESDSLQALSPEDRELMRPLLERKKAYGAMNANNPVSADFQGTQFKETIARQLGFSPDALAKASNSRALAHLAAFVTSPETAADWQSVLATPIRSPWIAVEVGWIVLFAVLRSWRLSKARGLGRRLFEHAWLSLAFLSGIVVGIPWLIYGKPYVRLLSGAAAALLS